MNKKKGLLIFALIILANSISINSQELNPGELWINGIFIPWNVAPAGCVDSDGGLDYYTKGSANSISSEGVPYSIEDNCCDYKEYPDGSSTCTYTLIASYIEEAYCGKSDTGRTDVYIKLYKCPSGCQDGACINITEIELEEQWIPEWCESTEIEEVEEEPAAGSRESTSSISILQKLKELGLEGKQTGDFDISNLEIQKTGYHTLIKQKNAVQHLLQEKLPEEMVITDDKGNSVNIQTENIQDSFNGYIVEFKDEPILEYKNELYGKVKKNQQTSANLNKFPLIGRILSRAYNVFALQEQEIPIRLENHRIDVENEHIKIKQEIIKKISQKTINEYKNVFNGLKLDVSREEIEKVKEISGIKKIYPNIKVRLLLYESAKVINADDLNKIKDENGNEITGKGITVAVIDTGVDYTHSDLGGCLGDNCKITGGYDVINDDDDPMDDHGHGTHVAATVAGNGILKGIAPDAKIYAIKVLDEEGSGSWDSVISGIERAVDPNQDGDFSDRVDIISMSLGGPGNPDDPVSIAVDNAVNQGVVAVIAAGNDGPDPETIGSPGTARKAITVAASDKCNEIAEFSSRGPVIWEEGMIIKPDVAAPGVDICAAQWDSWIDENHCNNDQEHIAISGTSMATPHVAGLAALLLQSHPNWEAEDVKSALMSSSYDIGYDIYTQGTGRIDALMANKVDILTNPPTISFDLGIGEYRASKDITIKNLKLDNISLTIDPGILKDENDNEHEDIVSVSESSIEIEGNSQRTISLNFNLPSKLDGSFYGKLIISSGNKQYKVPYSFSKYSKLTVIADSEGKEIYPSLYIHNEDLSFIKGVSQDFDFEENQYTFNVKNGRYTVYAIGDNEDWNFEYILSDIVDVGYDSEVEKTIRLSNSRPFLIKANSLDNNPLFLYEWTKGFNTYEGNNDRYLSVEYSDPTTGDRTVHISNKPDNNLNTDILLKYYGISGDWKKTGYSHVISTGIKEK